MSHQDPVALPAVWERVYIQAFLRFVICAIALMPLWSIAKNFQTDWDNHLWTIEYYGRYLNEHHAPPDVLNTPQSVGLAFPIFYGSKFYTFLGILSIPMGSAVAIRIFAFALVLAQSLHVDRAVKQICPLPLLRFAVNSAVTLSVFRLITLCERGDLPEFAALNFLTMAVCTLFVLLVRTARRERDVYGLVAIGLLYGLAALTHPLTGLFGAMVLTIFGTAGWLATRRRGLLAFGFASFAALCSLLGAWLYAVLRFGNQVRISDRNFNYGSFEGTCLTTWRDALLSGFKTWALHPFYSAVSSSEDFYRMDVQLAGVLLILCVGAMCFLKRFPNQCSRTHRLHCVLLGCSYSVFLVSLLVFCSPATSAILGHVFDVMQFPYRLAAYIDLSLLVAGLSAFGLIDWPRIEQNASAKRLCMLLVGTSLSLTALGFGTKVAYIESVPFYGPGEKGMLSLLEAHKWPRSAYRSWVPACFGSGDPSLANLPALYFWLCDYEVTAGFSDIPNETIKLLMNNAWFNTVRFNMGPDWGSVTPSQISVDRPTLLVTNVSSFPWNVLTLDGTRVAPGAVYAVPTTYPIPKIKPKHLATIVGPGRHVLSYAFVPDKAWLILQDLSWLALLVWSGLWFTVIVQRAVHRIQRARKSIYVLAAGPRSLSPNALTAQLEKRQPFRSKDSLS